MHGHMNCEVRTEFLYTIYMYISLQTTFNFMLHLPGGKAGEAWSIQIKICFGCTSSILEVLQHYI